MYFKSIKRNSIDHCNICGEKSKLTWDHIPPKSCGNGMPREYSLSFGVDEHETGKIQFPWTSQDGIKYRSICSRCNNDVLGLTLDRAYKEVFDSFNHIVLNTPILPDKFFIECSVNKLARAIAGHMLAAKNFYDAECTVEKQLREYLLNRTAFPPDDLHMYYYPYPYSYAFVARDVVVMKTGSGSEIRIPGGLISCINSYPLAFLLTDSKQEMNFPDLFSYCDDSFDIRREIPVIMHTALYENTKTIRHPMWPCNIESSELGIDALLTGLSSKDIVFSRKKISPSVK